MIHFQLFDYYNMYISEMCITYNVTNWTTISRFTPEVCIVPNVQNAPGTTRIPSLPNVPNISVCTTSQSSRQNLDSIVEAIRHLEGDHLFSEDHHHQVNF